MPPALQRFQRSEVQIWLVFFAAIVPLFPGTVYAAQAAGEDGGNALYLAIVSLLAGIVALMAGLVAIVRGLLRRRPEARDSSALATLVTHIKDHEDREERQLEDMKHDLVRLHERIDRLVERKP